MAKVKPKKESNMEEALWKSADKLRGSVEPAEYKHVVLSLFFLKFASAKFGERRRVNGQLKYSILPNIKNTALSHLS
ncbi:MAG: type I restriction-modification system subunit M N-terminal domain-containing protein [Synergistaceae bacterium]|nr:type I restriction-modification system subunit M N-terminal domain-containing protein [Synergistaceae bacterium]